MAYATVTDLADYLGREPDSGTERLLARASELIDDFLIGCTYNVDGSGNATDATTIAALNQACCAQVEYWLANGDELGDLSRVNSYSIEGISVSFGKPNPRVAPRAKDALRVAGIYPSQTPIHLP